MASRFEDLRLEIRVAVKRSFHLACGTFERRHSIVFRVQEQHRNVHFLNRVRLKVHGHVAIDNSGVEIGAFFSLRQRQHAVDDVGLHPVESLL